MIRFDLSSIQDALSHAGTSSSKHGARAAAQHRVSLDNLPTKGQLLIAEELSYHDLKRLEYVLFPSKLLQRGFANTNHSCPRSDESAGACSHSFQRALMDLTISSSEHLRYSV